MAAASRDGNGIRYPGGHIRLAVPVLAPGSHSPVRIQSERVEISREDRTWRCSGMGHIALPADVVAPSADSRDCRPLLDYHIHWLTGRLPCDICGHQNVTSGVSWLRIGQSQETVGCANNGRPVTKPLEG